MRFDTYFGERTLHESGLIDEVIGRLRQAGHVYEADGAVWLRTTSLGDDKDRVLLRSDGTPTYFAADVAYLESKRSRGFDHLIYVLGRPPRYVQRLKAMASAEAWTPIARSRAAPVRESVSAQDSVAHEHGTGELITLDECSTRSARRRATRSCASPATSPSTSILRRSCAPA